MREHLLDYILSDPDVSLAQAVDFISFYIDNEPEEMQEEIVDDLKHAYS